MAISTRRDPLTYELVKHALAGIADSMAVTIVRTARSFVVKQSMDFSTALCDAHGELAEQGMVDEIRGDAITVADLPRAVGILSAGEYESGRVEINA